MSLRKVNLQNDPLIIVSIAVSGANEPCPKYGPRMLIWWILYCSHPNNKKRSHTQLDSRKQVIAFQDRVITINIKEAQHPLKWEKQVIDKSGIMLKISTKSMHRVLVWEIGPANNTTRCSRLSKHRLLHAWHPSQLAINLSMDKSKWQIHVNNKSD